MFSFGCVKTVGLVGKRLVKGVYWFVCDFFAGCKLLSFSRFIRDFYYTFTSSFGAGFYSVGLVVLPIFHKPNNKNKINLKFTFISNGAL